jgi:antitoxin ParD1/3/4
MHLVRICADLYQKTMPQLNISVPDGLKEWADKRVAGGRYASTSDYIRDLMRRDQERAAETAWVQSMIDDGLASDTLGKDPRDVISEIIAEGREQRAAA